MIWGSVTTVGMAKYGESLRMNQNGIGHHGIVNYHTGSTLNVRMQGNVISNKTEPYDPKTVKLPREILQVLNTKLSIQDMLGIKQSQVKQRGNAGIRREQCFL